MAIVKGETLDHGRDDQSVDFKLKGGPYDGIKVRLYPFNNGHEEVILGGHLYIAPDAQDRRHPFMLHGSLVER
jgi:hypothetical protein